MPTVAELERLEALVARLTPLTSVQRGELIRAGDWNVVVSALIEVARSIVAREAEGTLPPHEHTDQVNIGWLDPRLRALVEKGPLGEPTAISRLDGITRRLDQESTRLEKLQGETREVRSIASDVAVREEKRDTDLRDIRRNLDAIPDAREDVVAVRETLLGLQGDIRQAIEIGRGLVVDGEPFDAGVFAGRVGTLEELRDRLTQPDGTILDASSLERRLSELVNTFVRQDELDDVISTRPVDLTDAQVALLENTLSNRIGERFSTDLSTAVGGLRGEMTDRFSGVDASIDRAITAAQPEIRESALAAVRDEIAGTLATAREDLRSELNGTLDQRLAAASADTGRILDERTSSIESMLRERLTEQVTRDLAASLDPLRADLSRIDQGMRANTAAVARVDREQVSASARIEAVARDADSARRAITAELRGEMDRRLQEQTATFNGRVADLERVVFDRINVALQDAARGLRSELEQVASTVARRESQLIAGQLEQRLRDQVRDAIRLTLNNPDLRGTVLNPGGTLNPGTTLSPGTTLNPRITRPNG